MLIMLIQEPKNIYKKQPDFKIKLVIHFDIHDNVKTTSPSIEIIILSDNKIKKHSRVYKNLNQKCSWF